MLRNGKSKGSTAWPRASNTTKKPAASNRQASDSDQELEGYISVSTCRQTFSDVIATALEKAEMLKSSETGIYCYNFSRFLSLFLLVGTFICIFL